MTGGSRRLFRTVRNSSVSPAASSAGGTMHSVAGGGGDISSNRYSPLGVTNPNMPAVDPPPSPKHFPFPNTPVDDDWFFESLMFFFTIVAAALQFLHLYRTVWWLPHSYTNQALNFYLIDVNLVAFIAVLLSRRFVYIVGCKILNRIFAEKNQELFHLCYRLFLFGVTCSLLTWCAYFVIQSHPIVSTCYLCYPILVYLILFGFKNVPFFELINWTAGCPAPLHACRSNSIEIRQEVEGLKTNFNNRMKQILFSSVLNAYYAGFIPCCFAQNFLHYDVWWASQHVLFIFVSSFVAYATHILSLRYCDILHRAALHLGTWDKLDTRTMILNGMWNADVLWPNNAIVRHGRDLYRAQGECNASEPGNTTFSRFYMIFKNPSVPLGVLLLLHLAMVLFQLVLLCKALVWYNIVSLSFLLFFNYYILYKIGRDYLVSYKMYKEEKSMHNKVNLR